MLRIEKLFHINSTCIFDLRPPYPLSHVGYHNRKLLLRLKRSSKTPSKSIKFVKEGQIGKRISKRSYQGLLDLANDWIVIADIGETKLTFPLFITVTLERPDIICYSPSTKNLIQLELTSPCEENIEV